MCFDEETSSIILPFNEVLSILKEQQEIYLRECPCRTEIKNCPPEERNVCLIFNKSSEKNFHGLTSVTMTTAVKLLINSKNRNLIHRIFYTKDLFHLTEICNCCFCCCKPNAEIKKNNHYKHEQKSNYVALTNFDLCTHCGHCEEVCFFDARTMTMGELHFNINKCFGCGVCVNNCPSEAISMGKDEKHGIPTPIILNC